MGDYDTATLKALYREARAEEAAAKAKGAHYNAGGRAYPRHAADWLASKMSANTPAHL